MSNDSPDPDRVGILFPVTKKVFQFIERCSPLMLFRFFDRDLKPATVDMYVIIWVFLELTIAIVSARQWPIPQLPLELIVSLRIIDIVQANVNVALFGPAKTGVAYIRRTLILAGINFIELAV